MATEPGYGAGSVRPRGPGFETSGHAVRGGAVRLPQRHLHAGILEGRRAAPAGDVTSRPLAR
eukprot:268890-Alexandrium_andersonii.AAC.1